MCWSLERIWFQFFNLNKSNYLVYFNENIFIRNNNAFIFSGPLVNNLFHITFVFLLSIGENHHISLKRKIPSTNQTYSRHPHLSHINPNRIQILVKIGTLHSLFLENLLVCESYIKGLTKRLFTAKGVRAKECLEHKIFMFLCKNHFLFIKQIVSSILTEHRFFLLCKNWTFICLLDPRVKIEASMHLMTSMVQKTIKKCEFFFL